MKTLLFILYLILNLDNLHASSSFKDEITFFNVGRGHAVLVNKISHVPLLIDAGSKGHPYSQSETYVWESYQESLLIQQISMKILDCWKQQSPNKELQGGNYQLNIIVTHPDEDHKNFIPSILNQISSFQPRNFTFSAQALLGGNNALYPQGFLADYQFEYSATYPFGLYTQGCCRFLESSGCITHLYCPEGPNSNSSEGRNKWSIITRVKLDSVSAILTGDADSIMKSNMLSLLYDRTKLESDLLLAPHHGSDNKTFNEEWDQAVNPQAIIIGAAPNEGQKGNGHPRGSIIFKHLNLLHGNGRIWVQKVMPHCILYRSDQALHEALHTTYFQPKQRLFDKVPNLSITHQTEIEKWHLTWVDVPIYTLWTTGSLVFKEDVNKPHYLDAPNGLMAYVAVPEFKYFISPTERDREPALKKFFTEFFKNGEGDADELEQRANTFSSEAEVFLLKEGLILKDGLTLYKNRAKILNALLEVPSSERNELFAVIKPLIQSNIRNFSARYRIFNALRSIVTDERIALITFLSEHLLLEPTDAARTATAIETFSSFPLDEAQEIMQLIHQVYPNIGEFSGHERDNVLLMVKAIFAVNSPRRVSVFNAVKPLIMPYGSFVPNRDLKACSHNIGHNSSLITLFNEEVNLDGLSIKLQEAFQYLINDELPDLYGENKHYFIVALKDIRATSRINFITEIIPLFSVIAQKKNHENWTISARAKELAKIYENPNFSLRINYCIRRMEQDRFLSIEDFKDLLIESETYAASEAAKLPSNTTS